MATPIDSVTGTGNEITITSLGNAPQGAGQVTVSFATDTVISSNINSNSITASQLEVTGGAFNNPWPTNPGSNGQAIQNDGSSGLGVLSWKTPPFLYQNTWNFNFGFQIVAGTQPIGSISGASTYFTTPQAYLTNGYPTVGSGNVIYMNVEMNSSAIPSSGSPVTAFTSFREPTNSASTLPTGATPYSLTPSSSSIYAYAYYLGVINVINLDTNVSYTGIVLIVVSNGNGNNAYSYMIVPGGIPGASSVSNFGSAPSAGFSLGNIGGNPTNATTFVYSA